MENIILKLNNVSSCPSFKEFIERINNWYGEKIAFKNYKTYWTYNDLYYSIKKLIPYFRMRETYYYCINIENPVFFCMAFFAIIISGKVAILGMFTQDTLETVDEITENLVIELLAVTNPGFFPEICDNESLAVIAQSSGTTSVSKGVMLSQKNLLSDTVGGMQYYDYPMGAVYYHVLPYFHLFGVVADMLGPLYSGGTICFSENKLNFFKDVQYFKPTHMNLPPAIVYIIEKMLTKTKNPIVATGGKLKKIMCAGAHLSEKSRKNLSEYGILVFIAYGLTECSPCVSMNSDIFFKPESVGRILPCCEVAIVDGEIVVRGDIVMLGYWNNPVDTSNTIRNGWLYTGDLGYIDDEGFLFLTGRKSNLIVFEDGTKLIPELLENAISSIPGVKECAVIKNIVNYRTRIKIVVVAENHSDIDSLFHQVKFCIDRQNLLDRVIDVLFSEQELPKNKLGKLIRR